MEELKKKAAEENAYLEKRKAAIDKELYEVEPLLQEAKKAVGGHQAGIHLGDQGFCEPLLTSFGTS